MPEGWSEKPAKLAQKDRDARWTVKWSKAKPAEDGSPRVDLAVPVFGYKNHLGIDRRHGLIRTWAVTDAAKLDFRRVALLWKLGRLRTDRSSLCSIQLRYWPPLVCGMPKHRAPTNLAVA